MPLSNAQLQQDFQLTSPDAHAVAQQWVSAVQQNKGAAVSSADLAEAITGIGLDITMQGAPQIQINLSDESWVLLDSGFLDPKDKGVLDTIEIQHPTYAVAFNEGEKPKKLFWRLFQVSPTGADFTIQTFWIPRVVDDLMRLHGPFSASRSSRTRAQFLQMCAAKVPYARFHSNQLTSVQQIAPVSVTPDSAATQAASGKFVGVSKSAMNNDGLTVKGQPMGDRQRQNANTLLRVADKLGAGQIATEALLYAAIWESNLEVYANNGTFWGVLSGRIGVWSQTDTAGMAKAFLLGDSARGYQGGGAIALAASITNPIEIAVKVEVPSIWNGQKSGNAYAQQTGYLGDQQALAEVDAIIQAGGGATGTGGVAGVPVEQVQQYNFAIGTSSDPHEDYWTGMNRLAQEVNWEIVVEGDDIYYDSDVTLCRGQVAAVLDRSDEAVTNWSFDWDKSQLPTNFQLELQCQPFDFWASQVFKLKRFGPASNGSSIKLPGRWLIGEIQRNPGDIVSTFTLVQPTQPLKEPAPQLGPPTNSKNQFTLTGKGVNPFANASSVVAERVDDGKDYSMAPGSEILAPFDSKFLGWYGNGVYTPGVPGPWYLGQPYMAFQIVGGSYNGWAYYFAEQISMKTFRQGQIIKAGTVIATYASSGTGIECGLANPRNWQQTLAQANGHGGMTPSPEGTRWESILKALGAPV